VIRAAIRSTGVFIKNQPVRAFALLCVAITSAYVMWMGYKHSDVLTEPGWCNRVLNADKMTNSESGFDALQACIGLLTIQLKATATNSHIYAGVIALCLLALMVIVVAGGHLSFTSPLGSANVGGNETPAAKAAKETADAAVEKSQEIAAKPAVGTNGEDG
jgi:hypothetical protein